jgi:uncharacterized protein (TIGR01777 family)
MHRKIILAGGSGYLGQVLADHYRDKATNIIVLSRSKREDRDNIRFVQWDGVNKGPWVQELENADLLVNLSGKNVNCRYTEKNRREILRSRIEPTKLLGEAIAHLTEPPACWIQFASATIYRHAEDHYQDEEGGEIGRGFSIDVCRDWEKAFWNCNTPRTKKVLLRVGIVLGRSDGVLPRLKNLVKMGMGGKQGNGRQYISWIHEQDLARITEWVTENGKDGDIYNATSPEAIQNADLMKLLRQTYGIPFGLPAPRWLLEAGAVLIGTETELILKSRWVYPGRLLKKGFQFRFAIAEHAVHEIWSFRE